MKTTLTLKLVLTLVGVLAGLSYWLVRTREQESVSAQIEAARAATLPAEPGEMNRKPPMFALPNQTISPSSPALPKRAQLSGRDALRARQKGMN